MKNYIAVLIAIGALACISWKRQSYTSNGESIYKTGKNLAGISLLDKKKSEITIFRTCKSCHGPTGSRIKSCDISWSRLTDTSKIEVPYTRESFYRFIDQDIKSDDTKAATGVHWQMTNEEKDDLMAYLQQLN
jgi:cytochrome c553